ncbi:hypothetical protein DPMN_082196 [Dreissena polymorpha]|uniref:Uncharacterized protein n=1 Tax=Dreissena polymorpha TaxID=45954 RepID=A0A9D3YAE1_DREPO|nr:hypothetical protein DPMN_082196 [Dreissena polymorpha]
MTLSEKVETLRSECDRLRDRAKHCEEALQRDSDFKVQVVDLYSSKVAGLQISRVCLKSPLYF